MFVYGLRAPYLHGFRTYSHLHDHYFYFDLFQVLEKQKQGRS